MNIRFSFKAVLPASMGAFLFFLWLGLIASVSYAESLMSQQEFMQKAFPSVTPELNTLWLTSDLKQKVTDQFNYQLQQLRLRYWSSSQKTAWILEEIGKERPITLGVVIGHDKLEFIEVLAYRESRGGEIQYPFFTNQFIGVSLINNKDFLRLNKSINGISGATLSVDATKKVAKVALFLHHEVMNLDH